MIAIDKVAYWIEIAEQDIMAANAMLKSKLYLYVGFMCHQAVEKNAQSALRHANRRRSSYT